MSLTDWPARAGAVALLWLALIQNPLAAVSVEDVSGNPLDSVTVGLFIDALQLDTVPGGFIFEAVLTFDPNLTLTTVTTSPQVAGALAFGDVFWPVRTSPNGNSPNIIGFNAGYKTDPGPFMNAEMLRLTFLIGPGAGPGPHTFSVAAVPTISEGASVVPLPPALLLCTGALAALSMFRRRT